MLAVTLAVQRRLYSGRPLFSFLRPRGSLQAGRRLTGDDHLTQVQSFLIFANTRRSLSLKAAFSLAAA